MSNDESQTTSAPADPPAQDDAVRQERDDLYDRLLRMTAEFDNYRKRTERERREQAEFAAADLIRDLLPLVDDLDRALAVPVEPGTAAETYRDGVDLIRRQFLELLRRRGVEALDVVGQTFDPEWHEAIAQEHVPGARDGEITAEIRRGYRMGPRLLRPAMVKVAHA
jgi:molecular chaperone GrpE